MEDRGSQVLLIEADRVLRDLILLALEREGVTAIHASEPDQAVSLSAHHCPVVVLLDLLSSYADGLNLIRDIRANLPRESSVVVISSLAFDEVVRQVVRAGANDFILKPLDVSVLVDKVRKAIAAQRNLTRQKQQEQVARLVEEPLPGERSAASQADIHRWVPGILNAAGTS